MMPTKPTSMLSLSKLNHCFIFAVDSGAATNVSQTLLIRCCSNRPRTVRELRCACQKLLCFLRLQHPASSSLKSLYPNVCTPLHTERYMLQMCHSWRVSQCVPRSAAVSRSDERDCAQPRAKQAFVERRRSPDAQTFSLRDSMLMVAIQAL